MSIQPLREFDPNSASAPEIISWAHRAFGDSLAVSSSFQTQSLPLLHMVSRLAPGAVILFLDTGFHFPETLVYRDRLVADWKLNLRIVRRVPEAGEDRRHVLGLPQTDPDLCCHMNKVEPMRLALKDYSAWMSGIRRDQGTAARAGAETVEAADAGVVRIHPILRWTAADVFRYIHEHDLPDHPLLARGYLSVGCAPCTQPVTIGVDQRSGRWAGRAKTECGLHTELRPGGQGT